MALLTARPSLKPLCAGRGSSSRAFKPSASMGMTTKESTARQAQPTQKPTQMPSLFAAGLAAAVALLSGGGPLMLPGSQAVAMENRGVAESR